MTTETEQKDGADVETSNDTLSITDNRTGKQYEIPIEDGTIRATELRNIKVDEDDFGLMTYDPAFMNTASCRSAITFIDGDKGILEYRGYPIEQLAEKSSYLEVAYLLIHGSLPTQPQLDEWTHEITIHTFVHENIKEFMQGFRYDAHPMGMLLASVGALSTFYPEASAIKDEEIRYMQVDPPAGQDADPGRVLLPPQPRHALRVSGQRPVLRRQLPLDDLQDDRAEATSPTRGSSTRSTSCSSSTPTTSRTARPAPCAASAPPRSIRTRRSPPASRRCTARSTAAPTRRCCGCCGGSRRPENVPDFIKGVKDGNERLMGFGHRVYKNFDPRAKIIKKAVDEVFEVTGKNPLLDIATELEKIALEDDYFISRKLYPNVDFYSGLIYEALGMPVEMFPVLFAIGRTSGWIAQWLEMIDDKEQKIARPRQIYTGPRGQDYVPMHERS